MLPMLLGIAVSIVFAILAGIKSVEFGETFNYSYYPHGITGAKRFRKLLPVIIFTVISVSSTPMSLIWVDADQPLYVLVVILTILSGTVLLVCNVISCTYMAVTAAEDKPQENLI